jgi:hypothetical protein
MTRRLPIQHSPALALAFTALMAQAQTTTFDPAKVVLPTRGGPAPSARPKPPLPARPAPARLSEAQFAALRPHLASLLNVSLGSLPLRRTASTNLATPGAMVNVAVGQTPSPNFFWACIGANVCMPGMTFQNTGQGAEISFSAGKLGAGTYLMTVYIDTNLASIPCKISESTNATLITTAAPVQAGMLNVVYIKSTPPSSQPLEIVVQVPASDYWIVVHSCDFTRIK